MLKSLVGVVILAGLALFGFYYLRDKSERTAGDKARDAGMHVLDTAKDAGHGAVVKSALVARFGMEPMRFVHVHSDQGRVVLYGLVPASVAAADMEAAVKGLPGVGELHVIVSSRPDFLTP
jgi:osmotically-inducible protein OsmY